MIFASPNAPYFENWGRTRYIRVFFYKVKWGNFGQFSEFLDDTAFQQTKYIYKFLYLGH